MDLKFIAARAAPARPAGDAQHVSQTRVPMLQENGSSGDMIAVLIVSATVGLVGFGLFFVDSRGPLVPTALTIMIVGGAACLIAIVAPKRWILVGVLCSWGSVVIWVSGIAAEIGGFRYAVVGFPIGLIGSYAGSRIPRARSRRAG